MSVISNENDTCCKKNSDLSQEIEQLNRLKVRFTELE